MDSSHGNTGKAEVASVGGWDVQPSLCAQRTTNPIRKIVDQMKIDPNPTLQPISLSIGDPTIYGNLPPPAGLADLITAVSNEAKHNGYLHSAGSIAARKAVASVLGPTFTADDIVLGSGCSGALEIAIVALANPGDNILLPQPAFSLYQTIAESRGIEVRNYHCLPDQHWEVDLTHLVSLVDSRTRAILINNPSNPCGSVFSKDHLLSIAQAAEKLRLPVISDEIYADMAFSPYTFTSFAEVSTATGPAVPSLICGGIAKRYMVPGYRLGWVAVHDPANVMKGIRQGILDLSTIILGPNSIIQGCLPKLLADTPASYYESSMHTLQTNAQFCYENLKKIPGLTPIEPQGAMYMMIRIETSMFDENCVNDVVFAKNLIREQSLTVLPGSCFQAPNFFRVVLCPPIDKLQIAIDRIRQFCADHARK